MSLILNIVVNFFNKQENISLGVFFFEEAKMEYITKSNSSS